MKKIYTYDYVMSARTFYNTNNGRFYHTTERDCQDVYIGTAPGYKTMVARYYGWDNDNLLYTVRFYNRTPARYQFSGDVLTVLPAGAKTADRMIEV